MTDRRKALQFFGDDQPIPNRVLRDRPDIRCRCLVPSHERMVTPIWPGVLFWEEVREVARKAGRTYLAASKSACAREAFCSILARITERAERLGDLG